MAFEATAQGYSFADVRPRIDRDVANQRFNVTYLVDEGPRVYVERINITGNDKTRDFVIRRELDFAEGDPFNRSMVQRGKTNIEALGFFKTVNVDLAAGQRARQGRDQHRRRSSSRPATTASPPATRPTMVSWAKCR